MVAVIERMVVVMEMMVVVIAALVVLVVMVLISDFMLGVWRCSIIHCLLVFRRIPDIGS